MLSDCSERRAGGLSQVVLNRMAQAGVALARGAMFQRVAANCVQALQDLDRVCRNTLRAMLFLQLGQKQDIMKMVVCEGNDGVVFAGLSAERRRENCQAAKPWPGTKPNQVCLFHFHLQQPLTSTTTYITSDAGTGLLM
jgi:hypothetical protein